MKKDGNRKEAIEKLTELIKVSPQNEEYYLDIINLHLQEGNREAALGWSSNGLAAIPGSPALITKRASILAELARYPETLVFIREQMRKYGSPAIRRMYNDLLMEAARCEKMVRTAPFFLHFGSAGETACELRSGYCSLLAYPPLSNEKPRECGAFVFANLLTARALSSCACEHRQVLLCACGNG